MMIKSLFRSFNMIKFCLVLILPEEDMFGFLVILSFIFICFGAVSLTTYAWKESKIPCPCLEDKTEYSAANTKDPDSQP